MSYVYIALFALAGVILKRFRISPFIKFMFLTFCTVTTFFALRVTDDMLFEHELNYSAKSFEIKSVSIERDGGAYLVSIVFEESYDNFLDMASRMGLHQVDLFDIYPHSSNLSKVHDKLIAQMNESSTNRISSGNENMYSPKTFIYDTEMGKAYYEHMNYNGKN